MMKTSQAPSKHHWRWWLAAVGLVILATALCIGTARDPNFWRTPDQRGDALYRAHKYREAAVTYIDPWRIGTAQYRDGSFEVAAKTFVRVPSAIGAYDSGNAWLMRGKYDAAIAAYDRALAFHPGWREALENRALAVARRDRLKPPDDADEEATEQPEHGETAINGEDKKGSPADNPTEGDPMADEDLRASWLRRVQTTPGDFLRAKFAWQAHQNDQPPAPAAKP